MPVWCCFARARVTWTRGSHIIKFGGQHIRNYKDEIDSITDGGDRGTYDFGVSASAFDTNYGPSNVLTGALSRFRQYTNLRRTEARLRRLLGEFTFAPIRDVIDTDALPVETQAT